MWRSNLGKGDRRWRCVIEVCMGYVKYLWKVNEDEDEDEGRRRRRRRSVLVGHGVSM